MKISLLLLITILFSASINAADIECTVSQIAADGEEFRGIGGSSDSNIIAVGHNTPASFYHYDGTSWTKHADTSDKQMHDVSVLGTLLAYAVGHDGRIMQYNGTNWTNFSSPTTKYLTSLWALSTSDIWIAGKENTLHQWDGTNWIDMSGAAQANIDSGQELSDIWSDATSVYTVEKDGDLYRQTKSASTWDKFAACNTDFDMEAKSLWSDGLGNVYIAGKNKTTNHASVFLYNENTNNCSSVFSSSTQDKFEGIYGSGSNVYAAGKKGLVASNISGDWVASTQGSEDLKAVWVSGSGIAYYSGKGGFATTCSSGSQPPSSCNTIPNDYALYSASSIKLTQNIKVNNQTVSSGTYSPKAAIDKNGTVTTNVNLTLPALNPATFPTNSATNDEISNSDITINATSLTSYRTIQTTKKGNSITFSGGGPFQINKLETKMEESAINFAAGIYYINELKLKKEDTVINITSAPVIIHIGTKFEIEKENVDVNKNGNIDDFIVYLHSGAKFKAKKEEIDYTGIIYGPNVSEVKFEKENVNFHGLIVVGGGKIEVKKENFKLTFTDADKARVDALGNCDSEIDHYEIYHDGSGITCLGEDINIKACANADCSSLASNDITATLNLGPLGQSVTISNGDITPNITYTTAGTIAIGLDNISLSAPVDCYVNNIENASCEMTLADSGFIIDMPTLTACKPNATATIQAVQTDNNTNTCGAALLGNQTVDFWSTYISPNSGSTDLLINTTPIADSSAGTGVSLSFDSDGLATFTVQYDDAGQVQLNAEHTMGSGLVLEGDNTFVSTPVLLTVYTEETNFECVSGNASCNTFIKAGENFDLKVNAACWENDADTDFTDNPVTPNFELSSIAVLSSVVAPSGGSNGSLDITSFNFSTSDNGIHTMDQAISEVGVFNFSISPSNYFGESLTTQNSPNIGRFYPDHFTITNTVDGTFEDACTGFSYSGQNFSYTDNPELTVTAYNAASTPEITQNYTGDFIKLVANNFIITAPTTDALQVGLDNINLVQLTWSKETASLSDHSDGSVSFVSGDDIYSYLHEGNSRINEFLPIADLEFTSITDSDGVETQALPSTLQPSGNAIHFGRLAIANTHGSELTSLPVTIQTEYFNAHNWQLNSADQCTVLTLNSDFQLSNTETNGGSLQAGAATMTIDAGTTSASLTNLINGKATMTFSAPGENNQGYVDILSQMSLNHDWLLGDYDNNGSYDDEATGRASFGIFKGSDNIIFRREVY
jgi:MSHA biogenesis protein MshQ